jgi:hypothetical protein
MKIDAYLKSPPRWLCCKNAGVVGSSVSILFQNRIAKGFPLMDQQNPFKWRHYEADIIVLSVRWYGNP